MYIYKQINRANHHTELNEFINSVYADFDEKWDNHIVPHAWGNRIAPVRDPVTGIVPDAEAISRDKSSIADFVQDLFVQMSAIDFHTKTLIIDTDSEGIGKVRKTPLPLYINCSNTSGNRNIATAKDVGIIFIDLDEGSNPRAIFNNLLTGYAYIAWTTTAHQWDKGDGKTQDKLRIALFLDKSMPANTIFTDYDSAFTQWIKDSAPNGEYWLDKSCTVISQPAIPPLYNQEVGYIEMWANLGTGTKCFDLTSLTIGASTKAVKAPTAPAKSIDVSGLVINEVSVEDEDGAAIEALSDDGFIYQLKQLFADAARKDTLLDIIKSKNIESGYTTSNYVSPTNPHDDNSASYHPASLNSLAIACILIGDGSSKTFKQVFEPIAEIIRRANAKSNADVWHAVRKVSGKNFAGWFAHVLTIEEKVKLNLIGGLPQLTYRDECLADNAKWTSFRNADNRLSDVEYVKAGVINSPFGSGKTYIPTQPYNHHMVIGVPTRAIRDQNTSDRCVTWDKLNKTVSDRIGAGNGVNTVVIDEAHGLPLIHYRSNAAASLNAVIDRCVTNGVDVVFQTGTMDYAEAALLMDGCGYNPNDYTLRRNTYNPMGKVLYQPVAISKGVSQQSALLTLITKHVLLNNIDELIYVVRDSIDDNEAIARELNEVWNINALSIDSKSIEAKVSKIMDDYRDNREFQMKDHGLQVILVTRLGCEGVNVCDDIEHGSVIVMHPNIEHQFLKQCSGRFRKAKSVSLYHCAVGNKMRYKDMDLVRTEFEDRRNVMDGLIKSYNKRYYRNISNFRESFPFSDIVSEALQLGFVWDYDSNKMVRAAWFDVAEYNHVSQHKFYQSIGHQMINMEVFGCSIADKCLSIAPDDKLDISQETIDGIELDGIELCTSITDIMVNVKKLCYIIDDNFVLPDTTVLNALAVYKRYEAELIQNEFREAGQSTISNTELKLIEQYLNKKVTMKEMISMIKVGQQTCVRDMRTAYIGKKLSMVEIAGLVNWLLGQHIAGLMNQGYTRCDAIRLLNTINNMWCGKVDSSGNFSGRYPRNLLQDYGVLNFGKESSALFEGKKVKVFPVV